MMSFEQMDCVFWREIALLSVSFAFPAKAMRYADETSSFHDSAKQATQWSYILNEYQDWIYTYSLFKSFDVAYLQLRVELHLN